MKLLFDFFPVIVFFAAFKFYDIYVATAASIVAAILQVGGYWFKHRRFERMHVVTLGVLVVFGTLTLVLRDDTFIKWKPTVVNWAFALVLLGSQWIGEKPVVERMLSAQIQLPRAVWRRMNLSWGLFFAAMGLLNLYVAFYYGLDKTVEARQAIWVDFKLFGMLGLTLVFTLIQGLFLAKHVGAATGDKDGESGKNP